MNEVIYKQAAVDAIEFGITYAKAINKETGEVVELFAESNNELRKAVDRVKALPSAQPEPTECIPDTIAIPSERDCVDLSERVTATFYDEEYEEWSQKTVTIRDVLDSVCDEYTVLPFAQPDHNELNLMCDGCYHYGKTIGSCTLCARYYPDLYESRRKEI